jgi:aldose 1-epimerase
MSDPQVVELLGPAGPAGMRFRLVLRPDLGGCVAGLWCGTEPVLRSAEPLGLQQVRASGSYPLVPFSNRIGDAAFEWAGQPHRLARNFEPEPHAIHGVGWKRAWEITSQSPTKASLRLRHAPDENWPFPFEAEQHFEVLTQGTRWSMQVRQMHPEPAPVGLGWHPYFAKRPGARLGVSTQGRWAMDERKLPTRHEPSAGPSADCDSLDVDHCFDGWDGQALLKDNHLRTRISSNLQRLVVFTQPGRDFCAIEPVSHVNNALQLAHGDPERLNHLGVRVLQPGEATSAWMQIDSTPEAP